MIRTTPTGVCFVVFYITRLLLVGASLELRDDRFRDDRDLNIEVWSFYGKGQTAVCG